MPLTARRALKQALETLCADTPAAYFRIESELSGIRIWLDVEGECFGIAIEGAQAQLTDVCEQPDALVSTRRATVLALLAGERLLLDAVLARELTVQADVNLLDRIARACQAFSEGALRSRRVRAQFDNLRTAWQ